MTKVSFNAFRLYVLPWIVLLFAVAPPGILTAQEPSTLQDSGGRVSFRSIPDGVHIKLEGRSRVIGTTAFETGDVYEGYYRVTASLDGYEPQIGYISFSKESGGRWRVDAYPIRRWGVVLRSAILPGWGQIYSGQDFKGRIMGGLGLSTVVLSAIAAFDYQRALDSYRRSTERYEDASALEDIERYRRDMEDKFDRAEESYDRRQIAFGALAGLWLFNVIDAALFSPEFSVRAGGSSLTFYMTPKRRSMAFLRSLFLPGWGQYYTGRKSKGMFICLSQLTSFTSTILIGASYRRAVDRFNSAKKRYLEATSIEEIESYRGEMDSRRRDADDLYRLRQLSLGLTLGIWGYNLLDSFLSFESHGVALGGISAGGSVDSGGVGIRVDVKF